MSTQSIGFDIFAKDRASAVIDSVGGKAKKAGEDMASGFDRATNAADETETKFEGVAYTMSGTIDVFGGLGEVMRGNVSQGLIQMAMGGADLAQGFKKSVIPAIQAMTISNLKSSASSVGAAAASVGHRAAMLAGAAAAKVVTAAQWLMNAAMSANPIGLVVLAIAALAAGLIYAYRNSETFRKIVDGAFKAIGAAARFMWNNMIAPVVRFLINGFATVADWIANMLDALGNIPGFGWAKDAAAKMRGAAGAARGLAANIKNIPDASVNVYVGLSGPGVKMLHQSQARRNSAVYYGRASGGPVRPGEVYAVGDNPDGSWNSTTELFVPDTAGKIMTQRQLGGGSGGGGGLAGAQTIVLKVMLDGREIQQSQLRLDRVQGK